MPATLTPPVRADSIDDTCLALFRRRGSNWYEVTKPGRAIRFGFEEADERLAIKRAAKACEISPSRLRVVEC